LIYGFWLPFWPFSFWPLYCLSFDIRLLITVLTFIFLVIVLSVLCYTASDYRLDLFLFFRCFVCPSFSRISMDKQYNDQKEKGQDGNQKPYIKGQTIQWPKR
jgi:hypothetical protein